MDKRDQIFNQAYEEVSAFAFDEQVVSVFSDMIRRSVPGYDTLLKGIAMYAMRFAQDNSRIYDLGASLGAVSMTVDAAVGARQLDIQAIDNSEPMIEQLQKRLALKEVNNSITPKLADLTTIPMEKASMVISNFTLQFLPPGCRRRVCETIYKGLNKKGVFILSEKVKSSDEMIDYYHGYKKINGYSDLEIAQKRQALEDMMRPDSVERWQQRLNETGFHSVEVWFQAFNFISIIAFK